MFTANKLLKIKVLPIVICLISFFTLSACAQMAEKIRNEALLIEWQNVENSTVLLNNEN